MGNHREGIAYEPEDRTERRAQVHLQGVTLELVRVPPVAHAFSRRSPRHLLMFTERGTRRDGESRADGSPTSTLRDTSDTFSVIPAHCSYEGWTDPATPADYLAVSIDPAAPLVARTLDLNAACRRADLYRREVSAEVVQTVGKARRLMQAGGQPDVLRSETLVFLLLQEVIQWLGPPAPDQGQVRGGLAPWQERRATAMLAERLDGGVGIGELAQACGLSPGHFARAFQRSTGMPPHRWLTLRRVDRARDLLARTELPLAEVALACGFAGQSHFGRVFAAAVGESPGAWRRSQRRRTAAWPGQASVPAVG